MAGKIMGRTVLFIYTAESWRRGSPLMNPENIQRSTSNIEVRARAIVANLCHLT